MKINLVSLRCKRCGHSWTPRKAEVRICPNCKSPYWDKQKERKKTMQLRNTFDHIYMYSSSRKQWIMIQCGCSETAPVCRFPKTIARGDLAGPRMKIIKVTDSDAMASYEAQYENAIMQLEDINE